MSDGSAADSRERDVVIFSHVIERPWCELHRLDGCDALRRQPRAWKGNQQVVRGGEIFRSKERESINIYSVRTLYIYFSRMESALHD